MQYLIICLEMKKLVVLIIVAMFSSSCGVVEMINGHDHYVYTNVNGRMELKDKKYKRRFRPEMAIFDGRVYYSYHENRQINYIRHSYLQLYPTGQFAYYSEKKPLESLNPDTAIQVGYYTYKNNVLKLETGAGNFNTSSFRVIWKFKKEGNKLIGQHDMANSVYEPVKEVKIDTNQPDW